MMQTRTISRKVTYYCSGENSFFVYFFGGSGRNYYFNFFVNTEYQPYGMEASSNYVSSSDNEKKDKGK